MKRTGTGTALARMSSGLLLSLLAAPTSWAATITGSDAIYLKSAKEPIRGVIAAETMDGIEVRTPDGKVSFPIAAVAQVDYYDAPEAWKRGHDRRQQTIYEEAINYFTSAPKNPNVRKFWIEPACLYYIGLCQLEWGNDLAAAEAKFRELLQAYKDSRWVPEAMLALGNTLYCAGNWNAALAHFGNAVKLFSAKTGWEEWLGKAYLGQAETYLATKRPEEGMRSVKKVVSVIADPKHDLCVRAKTVEAKLLLLQNKTEEAVKELSDLIKLLAPRVAAEINSVVGTTAPMQRTEAQCHNALGQALLKQYAASKKEEDLRGALLAFLWTVVLYPRAQFVPEHMEALHFASQCFLKLNQKARATELQNELNERYPDNPYTRVPGAGKAAGAPRKETDK